MVRSTSSERSRRRNRVRTAKMSGENFVLAKLKNNKWIKNMRVMSIASKYSRLKRSWGDVLTTALSCYAHKRVKIFLRVFDDLRVMATNENRSKKLHVAEYRNCLWFSFITTVPRKYRNVWINDFFFFFVCRIFVVLIMYNLCMTIKFVNCFG